LDSVKNNDGAYHIEGNQMRKFATITPAALLAVSLSSAAFAQAGANPSAPQPSSTGAGVVQPGMDKNGTATDAKMMKGWHHGHEVRRV
jgi:hypothetical protein